MISDSIYPTSMSRLRNEDPRSFRVTIPVYIDVNVLYNRDNTCRFCVRNISQVQPQVLIGKTDRFIRPLQSTLQPTNQTTNQPIDLGNDGLSTSTIHPPHHRNVPLRKIHIPKPSRQTQNPRSWSRHPHGIPLLLALLLLNRKQHRPHIP